MISDLDMDRHRVDKVLVMLSQPEEMATNDLALGDPILPHSSSKRPRE